MDSNSNNYASRAAKTGFNDCAKVDWSLTQLRELNLSTTDTLDIIRSNAQEDFASNGVVSELDEFDLYQSHLRKPTPPPVDCSISSDNPVSNPVLADFLLVREKRRSSLNLKQSRKVCVFCRNNGELQSVYEGHVLKDINGRTECPILRKYTCPLCGASGDHAHTIRHCPLNESGSVPGIGSLLKGNRLSTGKRKKRNKMEFHL